MVITDFNRIMTATANWIKYPLFVGYSLVLKVATSAMLAAATIWAPLAPSAASPPSPRSKSCIKIRSDILVYFGGGFSSSMMDDKVGDGVDVRLWGWLLGAFWESFWYSKRSSKGFEKGAIVRSGGRSKLSVKKIGINVSSWLLHIYYLCES